MIIDGHLDLAMNGVHGRDLTLPLAEMQQLDPAKNQTATTTFPEMAAAGVRICFGTLFASPQGSEFRGGYTNHAEAAEQASAQLDQYQRWQDAGWIRLLNTRQEVTEHLAAKEAPLGVVVLMEGADPIKDADDLPNWVRRGVRLIGPAWQRTRFAGGTRNPGPLTPAGVELVQAMKELGVALDASHLDDQSFWDAIEIGPKIIATHSNSRQFVNGNRHLTDDMAKAIGGAGGVIGLVFLNAFIQEGWKTAEPKLSLDELAKHARHYAELIGWDKVALGTDMDGGFGSERTPAGIDSYADIPKFLDFIPEAQRDAVAFGNWARWLTENL